MLKVTLLAALLAANFSEETLEQISASGRCADVAESADQRVSTKPVIAPGQAPVLSFRFYEGKQHHRFGNAELLLDDAGH